MAELSGSVEIPIPADLVTRELESILASKTFLNTARLSRFLRYVVERTLQGRVEDLKEYALGLEVFGRNGSYNPRTDPVVRVEARQLRFKLAEYYAGPGQADEIVISLPKGGYAAQFERRVVGLPVVGEAAAETADESRKEPETLPGQPRRGRTRKALLAAGCVAASAVVVYCLVARPWDGAPPSIAVLPFANLSADPANQYFSDGLTDEITDELSHIKTIRVIARSSAFQFKGKNPDIRDVGRQLNVATVLEGSVERYGDRVKIVAHLERVSDRSYLWSNTYERQASDVYTVQSELAAAIAANLKAGAVPAPRGHTVRDGEAYDAFLRGSFELEEQTTESINRAEQYFKRAIERDPEYAAAYTGLGVAIWSQAIVRGTAFRTEAETKNSLAAWRKAVELDPNQARAHAAIAMAVVQYQWDWRGADREEQAALTAGPSSYAETTYAYLSIYRRRFAQADEHLRRAQDLDPFESRYNVALCRNLEGRYAEARELYQMLRSRQPNALTPVIMINLGYVFEGHPELGLPGILELEKRYPPAQFFEAMARARMGQRQEALKLIHQLEEHAQDPGTVMHSFALVYAMLGEDETAVTWLERSAQAHEFQALNIAIHPIFARPQHNPRLEALKKRMGLDQ